MKKCLKVKKPVSCVDFLAEEGEYQVVVLPDVIELTLSPQRSSSLVFMTWDGCMFFLR